jgi:hypothetical protein
MKAAQDLVSLIRPIVTTDCNELQGQFPLVLQPGDRHQVVVVVKCAHALVLKKGAHEAANGRTLVANALLVVLWKTEHVIGQIASEFDVQWAIEQAKDLLVSVAVQSPAPLNRLFDVAFTLHNLSPGARRLRLVLDTAHIKSERLSYELAVIPEEHNANSGGTQRLAPLVCQERYVLVGYVGAQEPNDAYRD